MDLYRVMIMYVIRSLPFMLKIVMNLIFPYIAQFKTRFD